jgi:hypothetical protein
LFALPVVPVVCAKAGVDTRAIEDDNTAMTSIVNWNLKFMCFRILAAMLLNVKIGLIEI